MKLSLGVGSKAFKVIERRQKPDAAIPQFDEPLFLGLTRERYNLMLDRWYDVMGFDKETGLPRVSTFEANDMMDVADRLINEYGVNLPA